MMTSLLIPLTYFCLQTWLETTQAKLQIELDMMPDAFDDQYIGCAEEMAGIAPVLLEKEKSMSKMLRDVWENATEKWEEVKTKISLPSGFQDEYGRTIIAYTDKRFSSEFNKAVRENGKSRAYYNESFQFKASHYYLTRASQLLRRRCDVTYKMEVFRGISGVEFQKKKPGFIRFGQFASSSPKKQVAETFGMDTFFGIRTCFGFQIKDFSYFPEQEEVLIPVYEIFSVSPGEGNNSFVLRSTNRTCSHFNCAYLGREKSQVCVENSASRGGPAFPSELSPSLFGGSVILIHVAALKLFASF
ncbi:ecto-ADP-ribosyltransferase 5-like [Malaclemys terrapin pileata]|uniref:ecto-ADP-ribosyltransferase 5-like n=1 Tax=Malaclemys terrapin pileata TaxID=2991368 RepID=UPI0023A8BB5B|nr:ecto-ADP-ribosyltransferase 5-like [Malaclemys terrapin pileata]